MSDEHTDLFRELHDRFGSSDDRAPVAYHLGHLIAGISAVNTYAPSFTNAYRTLIEHHPSHPTPAWARVMELFDQHAQQVASIDYSNRDLSENVRAHYEAAREDLEQVIALRFDEMSEAAD